MTGISIFLCCWVYIEDIPVLMREEHIGEMASGEKDEES